jgi:phosphate transport system substrate-binding protein
MKKSLLIAAVFMLICPWSARAQTTELSGAGATFPLPLYSQMFDAYLHDFGITVKYDGVGSGDGIKAIIGKSVDFGASDAFLSNETMRSAEGKLLHIPTCLGAVSITYNLAGVTELRLSQDVLADIFLGNITSWNDRKIVKLNPKAGLPKKKIVVVHRSDGSGTTNIFTDYLSKVSPEWKEKVGSGKTVDWPVGVGVTKNSGVAEMVRELPGSIGYVEMAYAIENGMPTASLENRSGLYIKPTLESTSLSAVGKIPDDTRVSLTNTTAKKGYPITGFTWLIVYQEQHYNNRTLPQGEALAKLLWWVTHEGQTHTTPLSYAPLPDSLVPKIEKIIKSMTYDDKPLLR